MTEKRKLRLRIEYIDINYFSNVDWYSKVSIKGPVLSNVMVGNFLKSLYLTTTSTISEKIDSTVLFIYLLTTVPIKHPSLDFLKKSLSNDQ